MNGYMDAAVISFGFLITVILVYLTFKIVNRSHQLRSIANTGTEIIIEKDLDQSAQIVAQHFMSNFISERSQESNYSQHLLQLFYSRWRAETELTNLFLDYHSNLDVSMIKHKELDIVFFHPILKEHMSHLIIADSLIKKLKQNDEDRIIQETVHTYFTTVKFILLITQMKVLQSGFDLKPMLQEYKIDDMRFNLKEDDEGFEEITVQ